MTAASAPPPFPVKTLRQKVTIPASPAEVYEAFVDPKIHAAFTGSPAKGNRRVGSHFAACGGYIDSVHRELAPGRRIVQDWSTTEWPAGAPVSRLELTLKPVAKGTELRMVHSNVPASQADSYRQGWIDFYWKPLHAYFEQRAKTQRATVRPARRKSSRSTGR
jgi:activator of HSP90 ATPase